MKSLICVFTVGISLCADTCIHCICLKESGCKAIGCNMDVGSLSCGYYQVGSKFLCEQLTRERLKNTVRFIRHVIPASTRG